MKKMINSNDNDNNDENNSNGNNENKNENPTHDNKINKAHSDSFESDFLVTRNSQFAQNFLIKICAKTEHLKI